MAVRVMPSNQLRQWAADLIGTGCNSVDLLRHQIEVEQGWTREEDDFLLGKIGSEPAEGVPTSWAQFAVDYQTKLGKKKRTPLQLEARGKYLMKQLYPNRESRDSGPGSTLSENITSQNFPGAPKVRRHKTYKHKYPYGEDEPDDKLYPHSGSVDFSVLTAVKLSEAAQGPEPEPELEPEPESESESESELESCLPLSLQREIDADRARSIEMLRNLADTLDQEYRDGGRAHWGSEDRRTKMVFVTLDRSLLYKIIGVIVGQFMAALLGAAYKYMIAS